jgi:uncharacterized membrane protein YozB (DUF420 family)
MKIDRYFYSTVGAIFLVLMVIGFRHFLLAGKAMGGDDINPVMFRLDAVHGTAIMAWFVLFFVQALLISVRNRKLHMQLGWSVLVIGATIAVTGSLVAIRSVQNTPADFVFFGMEYPRFLLVMLTEIAMFTLFAAVGVLARKRARIHRPMMLMASMALITGAFVRIPFFRMVFGTNSPVGFFAPVFLLGAVLLLLRCFMNRNLDRWFAAGYASFVIAFVAAERLSHSNLWSTCAATILKL